MYNALECIIISLQAPIRIWFSWIRLTSGSDLLKCTTKFNVESGYVIRNLILLFVFHSHMKDRGSTYNLRNAQCAFRKFIL